MKRRTFWRIWGGLLAAYAAWLLSPIRYTPIPYSLAEEPAPTPELIVIELAPTSTPEPMPGTETQALAKLIAGYGDVWDGNGDARAVELQARALCWTVLNRVDDAGYPDTVEEVVAQRAQFDRYSDWNSPTDEQLRWARETVAAWKRGGDRVLPEGYLFIKISDGNLYFSKIFRFEPADCWGWSLPLPAEADLSDGFQG